MDCVNREDVGSDLWVSEAVSYQLHLNTYAGRLLEMSMNVIVLHFSHESLTI